MSRETKKQKILNLAGEFLGKEPKFENVTSENQSNIVQNGLNWYAKESKKDHSKQWFLESYPITDSKYIPEHEFGNAGFLVRMVSRGFPLEYVEKHILARKEILEKAVAGWKSVTLAKEATKKVRCGSQLRDNILDAATEKIDVYVDSVIVGKSITPNFDISNLNKNQQVSIRKYAEVQLDTFEYAYRKKNQDDEPMYSLSGGQCNAISKQLRNLIEKLNALVVHSKPTDRKPRKTQAMSTEKITKDVKFLETWNEFVGINPQKVVGASGVLVYHTEHRRLFIFFSSGDKVLSFKGTSLINFDEGLSKVKTLRKPEEQIPPIINASKTQVDKVFSKINAVANVPKGRTSEAMIFLKVYN